MQLSVALSELQEALGDTSAAVWSTAELEFILESALAQVNQVRPRSVRDEIPLVTNDDTYVLTDVHSVTRVDLLNADGKLVMIVPPQLWEVWGDNDLAGQTLYINSGRLMFTGYSLRVHGYGPWEWDAA